MKIIKRIATWFCIALACCVVLILLLLGALQTGFVKDRISAIVSSNLPETVQIESFSGTLPWNASLGYLALKDEAGVWLEARDVTLDWQPLSLLRGVIAVEELSASSVTMTRTPISTSEEEEDTSSEGLSDIVLPSVQLGTISFPEITLPAELTNTDDNTVWKAAFVGDGINNITGEIASLSGISSSLSLSAAYDSDIAVNITFSEDADGIVNALLSAPNAPLNLSIQANGNVTSFDGAINAAYGETTLADATFAYADTISFVGSGSIPQVFLGAAQLPSNDWKTALTIKKDDDVWRVDQGDINIANIDAAIKGGVDISDEEFLENTEIALNIPSLSDWNNDVSGALSSITELSGPLDESVIATTLTSSGITAGETSITDINAANVINTSFAEWINDGWAETQFTLDSAVAVNAQPYAIVAKGKLDDEKQLLLNSMTANTPYAVITGNAAYHQIQQNIDAEFTSKNIALANLSGGTVQGALDSKLLVEGKIDQLLMRLSGKAAKLRNLPSPVDQWLGDTVYYSSEVFYTPDAIRINPTTVTSDALKLFINAGVPLQSTETPADISIKAVHEQFTPITLTANILRQQTIVSINDISLETEGALINGSADLNTDTSVANGQLRLNSPSITPLAKWFDMPDATGALSASVVLSGNKAQGLNATANIQDVRIPSQSLALAALTLDASTPNVASLSKLDATLNIRDARNLTSEIESASVIATRTGSQQTRLSAEANGNISGRPFRLETQGDAELNDGSQQIVINSLNGVYNAIDFALKAPSTITSSDNSVNLTPAEIVLDNGTIRLQGEMTPSSVDASANITALELAPLLVDVMPAAPPLVSNATLTISGRPDKPIVSLQSNTNMATPGRDSKDIIFVLNTQWDNTASTPRIVNTLTMESGIDMGGASVSLPASLSLQPFAFTMRDDAALDGKADINLPTGKLNLWTQPLGHKLAGVIEANIVIDGTVTKPNATGSVAMNNGRYDHTNFGVCLRDIDMNADFTMDRLKINNITATGDQARGNVKGSGDINLGANSITTTLNMDKLALFCQGMLQGKVSGDVAVDGSFSEMLVKGDLALNPLEILIPTSSNATIPSVQTIYLSELKAREEDNTATTINLDVTVDIPERIFVRGRGLEAAFDGKLAVSGTASDPSIEGLLETDRGRLDLLGSNLSIESGTIRFINNDPAKPYINMTASSTNNGIKILVDLSGAVSKPELSLSSVPSRPNDEILALLLFGRPLQQITPFQAIQLAQATAALAGKGGGGPDVLGMARDTLGIDTLNVSQDSAGGATVGAGKYITDRVFVGVEQGTTPDSRKVKTEIEITPNLKAETTTGAQGAPTVGVEWRYDY